MSLPTILVLFFGLVVVRGSLNAVDLSNADIGTVNDYDWGCTDYNSTTSTSLYDYLWCSSLSLADDAYQTGFIQGILNNSLNPVDYAKFELQDCWWLTQGNKLYSSICASKSCTEEVADFFVIESAQYLEWANAYIQQYSIEDESLVKPVPENIAYVDYENETVQAHESHYGVVVMTPCLLLWPKLAQRLDQEGRLKKPAYPEYRVVFVGATSESNVYRRWVEYNLDYDADLARVRAILDNSTYVFDRDTSLEIFQKGMQNEIDFFACATATTT